MINDTLSKVAVETAEEFPLFTASPMYVFGAMLMVAETSCVQFAPSDDV